MKNYTDIILVGGPPSVGSTFLADLLDATQNSACGVELKLFASQAIYDFSAYKKNILKKTCSSSIYAPPNGVNIHRLHSYGLSFDDYKKLVLESDSIYDFVRKFREYYLSLRGKNSDAVWFEKTPQNINAVGTFFSVFPQGRFVFMIRNPANVYDSVRRRGFSRYVALATWLIDVAQAWEWINDPRLLVVRYEDLVVDPFATTSKVLMFAGRDSVVSDDVEEGMKQNSYRCFNSVRNKQWGIKSYGAVGNANRRDLAHCVPDLRLLWNSMISLSYSERHNMTQLRFIDALEKFDYYDDFVQLVGEPSLNDNIPKLTLADLHRLIRRWLNNIINADGKLRDIFTDFSSLARIESL